MLISSQKRQDTYRVLYLGSRGGEGVPWFAVSNLRAHNFRDLKTALRAAASKSHAATKYRLNALYRNGTVLKISVCVCRCCNNRFFDKNGRNVNI